MMILWQELKKISRQLYGSDNIFGFKSTVANQLYLLYCFSGKIYFTTKVHNRVRYLWYCSILGVILFTYTFAGSYLLFNEKNDFLLMLTVMNGFGAIQLITIMIPIIVYLCRDRIETMIEHVDHTLDVESDSDFNQKNIFDDAKKYFSFFASLIAVFSSIYAFTCTIDVILFFEEDKVSNHLYYLYPLPLVQNYSGLGSFFIATGLADVILVMILIMVFSIFGLVLYWNVVCCNQLASLRNWLLSRTSDLDRYTNTDEKLSPEWEAVFQCTLKHFIARFQKITRLINYLREFVSIISTIMIVGTFTYGVALLLISILNDMSLVLKTKNISGYLLTGTSVFQLYWMGQNLDDLISDVCLALYCTPWYRSVKVRKTICILISQTQSVKNISIFGIWGLVLNSFARYLHNMISSTNLLRRLIMK